MSNNTIKSDDESAASDTKMNKTLLNSMCRRRMSCPEAVQKLWDAVRVIRYQRQVPNIERIIKYMSRVHSVSSDEVTRQLGYCVRDGLLTMTKRKGSKGSKLGVEQEGYKLPDTQAEKDKHDWYCSECHSGGDVICCGGCNRVYHLSCINNLPGTKHKYLCSICQSCEFEETLNMKQKKLNRLLCMACSSLKDRYSFLVNSSEMLQRSITIGSPGAQIDIGSEAWRTKYLIHKAMDIGRMSNKARDREYTHLAQFTADVHTIVHNVVIFHGVHSNMADNARLMLRDCMSEVNQMRACHMCYVASVSKPSRHWFCLPCKPPHRLVYAKAKGYSYWPAKVIKVDGDKYEVRFFGGAHCRAIVDKSSIQPITTSLNSLQVKRSPSWSKACEELKRHQDMMTKDIDVDSSSSSEEGEDGSTPQRTMSGKKLGRRKSGKRKSASNSDTSEDDDDDENNEGNDKRKVPNRRKSLEGNSTRTIPEEDEEQENEDEDNEEEERSSAEARRREEEQRKVSAQKRQAHQEPDEQPVKKKKRGRPPKPKPAGVITTPTKLVPTTPVKTGKRRGRPPLKKKLPTVVEEEEEAVEKEMPPAETPSPAGARQRSRTPSSAVAAVKQLSSARSLVAKKKQTRDDKDEDGDNDDEDEGDEDDEEMAAAAAGDNRKKTPKSEIEKVKKKEEEEDDNEDDEDEEDVLRDTKKISSRRPSNVGPAEDRPQSPTTSSSLTKSPEPKKNEEEIVSSSCMEPQFKCSAATQTKHSESKKANKEIINKLRLEIEELKAAHSEQMKRLQQSHLQEIASTKKKQWCYNCEQEAIYHCCWNTAYCSTECQQVHWQSEHKRVCRRKR